MSKENPEGKKIVLSEKVKVKATKSAKHMEAGKVYELHPVHAEKLIKKNYVEAYTDKTEKEEAKVI